jgi:HEAT repeat protein
MKTPFHSARGPWLALAVAALCACGPREQQPEPYKLFDVVGPAVSALEARVTKLPAPAATAPDAETRERLGGLIESLRSTDARMKGLALEEAKSLAAGDLNAVASLLLDEANAPELRDGAARILGEHATAASAEALCAVLEKGRAPEIRRQCAFQLGRVAQTHVVPRLGLRLKYEMDGETVIWLAHALSRYGNLSGLDGVRILAGTARDENVRALAAQMGVDLAAEFGAPDLEELERRWNSGEFEAARGIVEPDDRSRLEGWLRIQRLSVFDLRQVDDARFALVSLDGWITPHLAQALHDTNAYTRVCAAQCLERRGGRARAAVEALMDALREPRVAPNAAVALGAIGDARAIPPLIQALERGTSLDVRVAAARALGVLDAKQALEPLARVFSGTLPADLRQAAAEALLAIDARADAFTHLKSILAARTGDVDGAESALGRHLAARSAAGDAALATIAEKWNALDVRADAIATTAETEARQRARSKLLPP